MDEGVFMEKVKDSSRLGVLKNESKHKDRELTPEEKEEYELLIADSEYETVEFTSVARTKTRCKISTRRGKK